jgi:hypothetical protein
VKVAHFFCLLLSSCVLLGFCRVVLSFVMSGSGKLLLLAMSRIIYHSVLSFSCDRGMEDMRFIV